MTEKRLRGIQMMIKRENMIDNSKGDPKMCGTVKISAQEKEKWMGAILRGPEIGPRS
jgi:hypothetical protein